MPPPPLPPVKIATRAALCDFICHTCRVRYLLSFSAIATPAVFPRPLLPLIQSRSYSSEEAAVSQNIPHFPRPTNNDQTPTPASTTTRPATRHGRRQTPTRQRLKAQIVPPGENQARASRKSDPASRFDQLGGMGPNLFNETISRDPTDAEGRDAEAEKLMKDLGLSDKMLDDLMDDEKFQQMMGDEMPDIYVFNEDDSGGVTMEESGPVKETIQEVDDKIRKLEEALQKTEEEIQKDPKGAEFFEEMMSLFDDDSPESIDDAPFEDTTVHLPSESGARSKVDIKAVILPDYNWSKPSQARVAQLNDMLVRAGVSLKTDTLTTKIVDKTWKCYTNARHALSLQPHLVPTATWDLLWGLFSVEEEIGVENRNRMHRVYMLAKDMAVANVSLAPKQQLLAIEAMFADGWRDEAIQNWKRHVSALGSNPATLVAYWTMGVNMHCGQGDLERAGNAVRQVLTSGLKHDPRILLPYINACAGNPEYKETAWTAYRQLRNILGSKMKLEDYDEVINSFLSHNLVEHGLYAFVDMMSRGTIDLHGRRKIPGTIANKFFFGKWLKRLIGAGDLKGAESVVTMMLEKGVRPAPIQLNGLIGAWLRAGTSEYRKKAHEMAWEMIYSRLDFVQARAHAPMLKLEGVSRPVDARPPEHRPPRATSETFALLATLYRNQVSFRKLEALWNVVKAAEIEIDGYLLTPLLETYQKTGREEEAFDLIFKSAHHNRLQLTWGTFKPLWVILGNDKMARSTSMRRSFKDRHLARRLFSEMMKSAASLLADQPKVPEHLARLILPTFIKLDDVHGALIALHALVDRFNMAVTEPIALHVLTGQWAIDHKRTSAHGSALRMRRAAFQIAKFLAHRLASTGRDLKSLTAEVRSQELTLFLDRVLSIKIPGLGTDKDVDNIHQYVSTEMGVKYQQPQKPENAEAQGNWETGALTATGSRIVSLTDVVKPKTTGGRKRRGRKPK